MTSHIGYIGSHTCKALAAAGYTPFVFDNLSAGHRWAVKWGPLVVADISDSARVLETIQKYHIRSVIHFAAHAYVGGSIQQPRKYFDNNVTKILALLDSLLESGITRLVFSSSCATCGVPQKMPINEDHPQQPINPYGASKLFVENVKALNHLLAGGASASVNLRTGRGYSIRDVISAVEAVSNRSFQSSKVAAGRETRLH